MTRKILLIIFIICLINTGFQNFIRLGCKTYTDFNVVLENIGDKSKIIKFVVSKGRKECVLECVSVDCCRAVNFERATGKCELVERGLTSSLEQRPGWTYLTNKGRSKNHGPNCSTLSPCQNSGKCFDKCADPGFECICDSVYTGKYCEQVKEFASCKEAYENGFTTSGVYKLTGMGYHYCVMTSLGKCSGAGWTLIMKTKGGLETFAYSANYWTTANTYNHVYALNEGINIGEEAKFEAYNELSFTKVCLGFETAGTRKYLQIEKNSSSMLQLMNSGYQATTLGPSEWQSAINGSKLLPHCNREGFNVLPNLKTVRIGLVTNPENDCKTPDGFLGIGIGDLAIWCGMNDTRTGNQECYSKTDIKADGFILVK